MAAAWPVREDGDVLVPEWVSLLGELGLDHEELRRLDGGSLAHGLGATEGLRCVKAGGQGATAVGDGGSCQLGDRTRLVLPEGWQTTCIG